MLPDVLANTVERAFNEINSGLLSKVADRWTVVLDLIIKGRGGNDLVEKAHGLKAKLLDDELEIPDSDDEHCERMVKMRNLKKEEDVAASLASVNT